jgi:hypothetical protein
VVKSVGGSRKRRESELENPGDYCQTIKLRVGRSMRGSKEKLRLKGGGRSRWKESQEARSRVDEASREIPSMAFPLDAA